MSDRSKIFPTDPLSGTPATEETLQAILAATGGSLPYDNIEVDTSNPVSITITKMNGATVVDTKTINII
jgi:arylamine N-acetyltransferase